MDSKVNYIIVGLFVLVLSSALIGGILWLGADSKYRKSYDVYLAYMHESVSGLNLNAPVKYRGVEVGRVRKISLDPANPEQVRLEFDIERGTPIKVDTVAVLRIQGLTGIAYVDLSGGSVNAVPLAAAGKEKFPVIKTGPSLLARLDIALNEVLSSLDRTSANINAVLDDDNRKNLKRSLADLATLTHVLAGRSGTIDSGIADTAQTMQNAARASAELPQLMARIGRSADAVEQLAAQLGGTSAIAGETLQAARSDVRRFTDESLPELERTLGEIRELSTTAHRVAKELEQRPSVLLYGKPPAQPGPGE